MIPKVSASAPLQDHYLHFLQALAEAGFAGDICPDYANRTVHATDNSIYQRMPQGVLYPANEHDLVILCRLAGEQRFQSIVLTPRGGGTGTNGQSLTDGLVVDLSKHMNRILEINAEAGWVRVQAGVVKDQLNAALKAHNVFFAPELSTSNRATIGGMINTDASGQGSCVYGKTRDHVIELRSVLLDGSVLASRALDDNELEAFSEQQDKCGLVHRLVDNIDKEHRQKIAEVFPPLNRCLTGYDLAHIRDEQSKFNLNNILCGSEGTLGFISEAKLNVLPIAKCTALVIVKYANFDASLRDAQALMASTPTSIETIDSKVLLLAMQDFIWHQVEEFFNDKNNDEVKGINLIEFTAPNEAALQEKVVAFTRSLDKQSKAKGAANAARLGYALAVGHEAVNRIWAMRKRAVGLLGNAQGEARPVPFVEDTAVPPEYLADFIAEFRQILDSHNLTYGMFGHVDAGVLHVRPALDMKNPEHEKLAWKISDQVAALTQKYGGLLWGEHGKGIRSAYAPDFFGELYPQLQRIKAAFDPHNQLNPGKIATPAQTLRLLTIDEVTTRGQRDRIIPVKWWNKFSDAVYCNGNGACFNWNTQDAMCPSWKATRERTQSPKGRASLLREWLSRVAEQGETDLSSSEASRNGFFSKVRAAFKRNEKPDDFSREVYASMATCLACKSCAGQCPIKVNVPEFRSQFLEIYHTRYFRPLKDYLVASLETSLPLFAKIPAVYNFFVGFGPSRYVLERVFGFVDGPKLSGLKLDVIPLADTENLRRIPEKEKDKTVVIVQDAFTSFFETSLVIDIASLLTRLGFKPMLLPFKANGKPLHVHGFLQKFARVAEKNTESLLQIEQLGLPLVGIDPSMTLTYKSEYRKYVTTQSVPEVRLIQDWLLAHAEEFTDLGFTPGRYYLMPHCTERTNATESTSNWQTLFNKCGLELEILDLGCCGMSGTFGHEARNKATSQKLYTMSWKSPVDTLEASGKLMATGFSCRSQIKREAGKHVQHPLQALLKAIK